MSLGQRGWEGEGGGGRGRRREREEEGEGEGGRGRRREREKEGEGEGGRGRRREREKEGEGEGGRGRREHEQVACGQSEQWDMNKCTHTRECTHVVCAHMHTHARTHTHTHTEHAVAMDYRWPLMTCGIVTSFAGEQGNFAVKSQQTEPMKAMYVYLHI